MTRFTQAASMALVCFAVWLRLLTWPDVIQSNYYFHVQYLPIYVLLVFGLTSVAIILYRVATFNNCIEANNELMEQIQQAKAELANLGFQFKTEKEKDASLT